MIYLSFKVHLRSHFLIEAFQISKIVFAALSFVPPLVLDEIAEDRNLAKPIQRSRSHSNQSAPPPNTFGIPPLLCILSYKFLAPCIFLCSFTMTICWCATFSSHLMQAPQREGVCWPCLLPKAQDRVWPINDIHDCCQELTYLETYCLFQGLPNG